MFRRTGARAVTPHAAFAAAAVGALGGAAGTVAMSAVMLGARRAGLISDQPPERITATILDAAGLRGRDTRTQDTLAALLHLGFGVTAGAVFGLLRHYARPPIPPPAQGVMYGGLVWLVSYAGWIPALGIMPAPTRDEPRRPVVMVVAHCVYGGVLGAVAGRRPARR